MHESKCIKSDLILHVLLKTLVTLLISTSVISWDYTAALAELTLQRTKEQIFLEPFDVHEKEVY